MSSFEEDLERRVWAAEEPAEEEQEIPEPEAEEEEDYYEEVPEEQPKKKKTKQRKRRKRRKKHPFLALLLFVLLIVGVVYVLRSNVFAITKIEVSGNRYYTPSQIIELSGIESGKNLLFELNTREARNNLLSTPYISFANVERVPLGTVNITIEERLEYAAVSFNGQFIIIDKEGTVLRVTDTAPELTIMEGISVTSSEEGKPIKAEQTYLLTETLRLLDAADKADMYFKKVFFSTAVVRAYIYDDYYCEGAPDNILKSLDAIKELAEQHFAQDVNKGIVKVGTDGYLSFQPRID